MIKLFKWNWIRAYYLTYMYRLRLLLVRLLVCNYTGHRWKWAGFLECGCCGYEGMRCLLCGKAVIIGICASEEIYGSAADDL